MAMAFLVGELDLEMKGGESDEIGGAAGGHEIQVPDLELMAGRDDQGGAADPAAFPHQRAQHHHSVRCERDLLDKAEGAAQAGVVRLQVGPEKGRAAMIVVAYLLADD